MKPLSVLKYLVPKGVWRRRTLLLFSFFILDFIVTVSFCRTPDSEGNLLARNFMQAYGIEAGLAIFDFLLALPIYAILCVDSYLIKYTEQHSAKAEWMIDLALGWLVAGAHFNGAASWFWVTSNTVRQASGFIIYEVVALLSFYSSRGSSKINLRFSMRQEKQQY